MITPIFIPMNYGSGHFDISSVHHPIVLLVFVVLPILLTTIFCGLGAISMVFNSHNFTVKIMTIAMMFFGSAILGAVIFAIAELFSCI